MKTTIALLLLLSSLGLFAQDHIDLDFPRQKIMTASQEYGIAEPEINFIIDRTNLGSEAYHLYFVSDDKSFAGHVMEFEAEELAVSIDYISQYQFEVPTSEEFVKDEFDKEFHYNNN